jgi:hypothetical protein
VGAHVGISICEKSPGEAAVAMAVDILRDGDVPPCSLAIADILETAWMHRKGLFSK